MKYTITILLDLGVYKEFEINVAIDPDESWEHFLSNTKVKKVLATYPDHKVIDIDPDIEFKKKESIVQPVPDEKLIEE
jgi:hypothetical protein